MHNQHTFFPVSAHIQTRHNISRIEGSKITIKKSKSGYALGVLEGVGLFVLFEDGIRVLKPNEIEYPRYKPGELVEVRNNFGDSFYQARVVYKKKVPPSRNTFQISNIYCGNRSWTSLFMFCLPHEKINLDRICCRRKIALGSEDTLQGDQKPYRICIDNQKFITWDLHFSPADWKLCTFWFFSPSSHS